MNLRAHSQIPLIPRNESLIYGKRIGALYRLLSDDKRSQINIHELRFASESLGPEVYTSHNYYERWTLAIRNLPLDKNVLSELEIAQKFQEIENRRHDY